MNLKTLDWDRLKTFQAVADTGTFSGAATQLAVSQAKVSRDIELLEHAFGQELFLRTTRGVALTEVGETILKRVRSMADSAEAISSHVSDASADGFCRVTIAAHDAIATYWLARRVARFNQSHPNVEVMLKVVQNTPNVADGDADIAIQYEPPSAQNLFSRPLGWLHYILFASPDYLSVYGIPETMFDIGKHRFLLHTGYNKQVDAWDPKTPAWKEVLPRAVQSNSSTVILETCANDGGVAPMPSYVAEFEHRVRPLTHIKPLASIRLFLVYSERVRDQRQFAPVLAWLRDCFDSEVHPCFRETFVPPPWSQAS